MNWFGVHRGRGRLPPQATASSPPPPPPPPSGTNPMGLNYPVGGAGTLTYMTLPLFQNGIHSCTGFVDTVSGSVQVAMDSAGWPSADFQVVLCEFGAQSVPWYSGTWKCGYTSKNGGAETVAGNLATVSNKVVNGNLVTFDLTNQTNGTFGFKVTGTTGGVTNVFANLPAYPNCSTPFGPGVDEFTTEAVNLYNQVGYIRWMQWGNAGNNNASNTSATLRSWANTQTQMGWGTSGSPNFHGEGYPLQWAIDFCVKCNIGGWFCVPQIDDGTYIQQFAQTLFNGMPAGVPIFIELGNEMWNGGFGANAFYNLAASFVQAHPGQLDYDSSCSFTGNTTNGSNVITSTAGGRSNLSNNHYISGPGIPFGTKISAFDNTANTVTLSQNATATASTQTFGYETFTIQNRYLGERLHGMGVVFQSVFGGRFGKDLLITGAWQSGGNGLSCAHNALTYLARQYGSASAFAHRWAIAPYYTRDNTSVPGDGVNYRGNTDSIALIEAELTRASNYQAFFSKSESISVLVQSYGLQLVAYEGCWDSVAAESAAPNISGAIEDSGMIAVESNYYQRVFESGFVSFTRFEGGSYTNSNSHGALYTLTIDYNKLITGLAPRFQAMQPYFSGLPTPVRNTVTGSGSIIQGINYVDNRSDMSATLPTLGGSSFSAYASPYYATKSGTVGYLVNCTVAGNYTLVAQLTTTQSGTTDVEVDGTIVYTGVAIGNGITNGNVTLGTIALVQGPNYLCLGHPGTTQPGITINSLTFN